MGVVFLHFTLPMGSLIMMGLHFMEDLHLKVAHIKVAHLLCPVRKVLHLYLTLMFDPYLFQEMNQEDNHQNQEEGQIKRKMIVPLILIMMGMTLNSLMTQMMQLKIAWMNLVMTLMGKDQ